METVLSSAADVLSALRASEKKHGTKPEHDLDAFMIARSQGAVLLQMF